VFEIGPQLVGHVLGVCRKVVAYLFGVPHAYYDAGDGRVA
jgi:hypothetical protein